MKSHNAVWILFSLTIASAPLSAKCLKSEVVTVLDDYGYTYSELEDDGDYNFLLSKDGERVKMWVEPDGDLSLRKWFTHSESYTNDDMAQLMTELKYLKAYIDDENDIVMAYDYPSWGPCPSDLREIINLFFDLVDSAEDRLVEAR
jgi:hypothetical protein